MTKENIKQFLLSMSGQYNIKSLDIPDEVVDELIIRALDVYSDYKPYITFEKINISNSPQKIEYINGKPVKNISSIYIGDPTKFPDYPTFENFKFNKSSKELYTVLRGKFWAKVWFNRSLDDITNDDTEFLDLLLGYFLISLATARTNFTASDLPFETNAEELKQRGEEIIQSTLEKLSNTDQFWWEAIE